MPLSNPEKSFNVAVRHLFRHIRDATELRRNPLAKPFFGPAPNPKADALGLTALHARMLQLATTCEDETGQLRRSSQVGRGYQIIGAIVSGRSAADVASELGLSIRQYYRDRHAICTSVARSLVSPSRPERGDAESEESLQLLLRRATLLDEQGLAGQAIALLEDASRQIGSTSPLSEGAVLITLCRVLISYGDVQRATEVIRAAHKICAGNLPDSPELKLLLDFASLADIEVARSSGHDSEAAARLDVLVRCQRAGDSNAFSSHELALALFVDSCISHMTFGRFAEAQFAIYDAFRVLEKIRHVPPELRVHLAAHAAACSEDGEHPLEHTLSQWNDALRASISNGSAIFTFYSLLGLMRCALRAGDEQRACSWFDQAIIVARKIEGTQVLLAAAIAGGSILSTRFWRKVGRLLIDTKDLASPNTLKKLGAPRGCTRPFS